MPKNLEFPVQEVRIRVCSWRTIEGDGEWEGEGEGEEIANRNREPDRHVASRV